MVAESVKHTNMVRDECRCLFMEFLFLPPLNSGSTVASITPGYSRAILLMLA
jgi:hypothetical protein